MKLKLFFKSLTPDEKFVLTRYSDRNGSLRLNRVLETGSPVSSPELTEMVTHLDSLFGKQQDGSQRALYRGVERFPDSWDGKLTEGSIVDSLGYMSTTLNPHKAFEFSGKDNVVLMEIKSVQGVPVLVHENEFEILLPRNQSYRVMSVKENLTVNSYEPDYDVGIGLGRMRTKQNVTVIALEQI